MHVLILVMLNFFVKTLLSSEHKRKPNEFSCTKMVFLLFRLQEIVCYSICGIYRCCYYLFSFPLNLLVWSLKTVIKRIMGGDEGKEIRGNVLNLKENANEGSSCFVFKFLQPLKFQVRRVKVGFRELLML
ncbi:hypothetical protein HN51_051678 [Arachis hypogaea]|nr:uncharacterized protein DS421_17g587700 [Arachis hypogaea]